MDLSVDEVGQPTSLFNCPINRPLNVFTTKIQILYLHFMPCLSATSFCFYFYLDFFSHLSSYAVTFPLMFL